jgi:hypothetical protein
MLALVERGVDVGQGQPRVEPELGELVWLVCFLIGKRQQRVWPIINLSAFLVGLIWNVVVGNLSWDQNFFYLGSGEQDHESWRRNQRPRPYDSKYTGRSGHDWDGNCSWEVMYH